MTRVTNPRAVALLKFYLGLLAVGIVLCGVLAHRHIAALLGPGDTVRITTVPYETPLTQRGYLPTINWGGAKR
jgi:hypothetical protein